MADLNVCTFVGRVTRDAVVESVGAKGTQITKFAIANNTGYGQYEKTNFFNVQIWGKQGVSVSQYLVNGKQIAVSGTLENNKWTDQNGNSHDSWNLTAQSVALLADAKGVQQEVSQTAGSGYTPEGDSVF